MKALPTAIAAVAAVSALTFTAMPTAAAASSKTCGKDDAKGLEAVALTKSGRLLCLDVDSPEDARSLGKVDGLDEGTKLVGIDYRPQNGKLYGLGSNGAIYRISAKDADASRVVDGLTNVMGGAAVSLDGTAFGVDFNSTVDRLRVISNTGQNLRINVADGVTNVDTELNIPPSPTAPAMPSVDGLTGAAYTNNDKLTKTNTATTLFDVDTDREQLSIQSPANGGAVAATGKFGRNVDPDSGFDIYSKLKKGQARSNVAYAALSNGSRSTLYKVDLLDGSLSSQGKFDRNRGEIIGLALPLDQD